MAHGGRARGGRWGGGTKEQCGSNKSALFPNNWSDLAGDEGGGMGGGLGRWPMEGGQGGEMGGRCTGSPFWASLGEVTKVHWFPLLGSLKSLTTGLIDGGDGGRRGEVAHGGRARGEMVRGHERGVWEQKMHWFRCWGSLRPNNWSDLAGDEGGGDGGSRGEVAHGRAGQGGEMGEQQKVHWFSVLGYKPNNWSDLAGDEGGGMGGQAWGGGPWRAGKGGKWGGGHHRAVWEQQKKVPPFLGLPSKPNNWSDLAGDKRGGMGEGVGEVAHGGRARGEMRGGHQRAVWEQQKWRAGKGRWGEGTREQCGSNKRCTFFFWGSLKNLTTGLIWLGGWGGSRGEVVHGGRARGGDGGGGTREQCGEQQKCTGSPFLGSLKNLTTGAGAKAWGGWPREEMGAPESS